MENKHIVGRFDKDLSKIKAKILTMGDLVNAQIKGASEALVGHDVENADRIIANDRRINGMNRVIAGRAERLIALRQPMALDLRASLVSINIASELERIGDHAKATAKRAKILDNKAVSNEILVRFADLSTMVQAQLTDVLVAYREDDSDLATSVRARDAEVDRLYKALFNLTVNTLSKSDGAAENLVSIILVIRSFERVGDHISNMAHYINHIVSGSEL